MDKVYFNIWPELSLFIAFYKAYYWIINLLIIIVIIISIIIILRIIKIKNKINKIQKDQENLLNHIKHFYKKKLANLEGKEFIKGFINYSETLTIQTKYKNIDDLLAYIGLDKNDIEQVKEIIYLDKNNRQVIEKIKKNLGSN